MVESEGGERKGGGVRLAPDGIDAIKAAVEEAFASTAVVRLFGSRLDDKARDIDLHVEADPTTDEWHARGVFDDVLFRRIEPQKDDLIPFKTRRRTTRLRTHSLSRRGDPVTPEQEVLTDQLSAIAAVERSGRETMPLIGEMPADDAAFAQMTPLQRMAATAGLKQFEQLEGLLSGLFRAILRTLGVRLKGLYPLDIANRMAELGILDDPHRWVAIVKLRNDLVHEYPLGSSERYDRFITACDALPFLFSAAEHAHRVVVARRLLEPLP